MRFKKLLVGIDFTPPSHEALRVATTMSADAGGMLVLAHVMHPIVPAIASADFPITFEAEVRRAAEADLAKWKAEAEQAGAQRVSTVMMTGAPWHEIVELLRRDPAFDLAVVGTHGRTGIRHVLL